MNLEENAKIYTEELNEKVIRELGFKDLFETTEDKSKFIKQVSEMIRLKPSEWEALTAISRWANKVKGVSWVTVPTLLERDKHITIKERAFRSGITGLIKKGILLVKRTLRSKKGGQGTNIYILNVDYVQTVDRAEDAGRPPIETPCESKDEQPFSEPKELSLKESLKSLKDYVVRKTSLSNDSVNNFSEEPKEKPFNENQYMLDNGVSPMFLELTKGILPRSVFPCESIINIWEGLRKTINKLTYFDIDCFEEIIRKSLNISYRLLKDGKLYTTMRQAVCGMVKKLYIENEKEREEEKLAMERAKAAQESSHIVFHNWLENYGGSN